MALKSKKPTLSSRVAEWMNKHNTLACAGIFAGAALALVGLFAFVVFSGFGSSADFIYNQF